MDKIIIILRGASGSGKSTWAENIACSYDRPNIATSAIVSADYYRYDTEGNYHFDPQKLGEIHDKCFAAFQKDIDSGVTIIFVDNTNIKKKEYQRYVDYGREHGYSIFQKVFTGEHENEHGVPIEVVERMRNTLEIDNDLAIIHWA